MFTTCVTMPRVIYLRNEPVNANRLTGRFCLGGPLSSSRPVCFCDWKVLNLNLNPVVWKTILSRKVRQSDLELVDPTYHK